MCLHTCLHKSQNLYTHADSLMECLSGEGHPLITYALHYIGCRELFENATPLSLRDSNGFVWPKGWFAGWNVGEKAVCALYPCAFRCSSYLCIVQTAVLCIVRLPRFISTLDWQAISHKALWMQLAYDFLIRGICELLFFLGLLLAAFTKPN